MRAKFGEFWTWQTYRWVQITYFGKLISINDENQRFKTILRVLKTDLEYANAQQSHFKKYL